MTTAYPDALDDLSSSLIPGSGANPDVPLGSAGTGSFDHPDHHATIAGAVEALQAKVGPGASLADDAPDGYVLTSVGDGTSAWEAPPGDTSAIVSLIGTAENPLEGNEVNTPPGGFYVYYSRTAGHAAWVDAETAVSDAQFYIDRPRKATVTLSSADILDLHNTPVTLVAAPGAGKWVSVKHVDAYLTFGTVPYTVIDPPRIGYTDGAVYGGLPAGLLTGTADGMFSSPYVSVGTFAATTAVNTALSLYADGSPFTDGDGTLTITVYYTIEDVPA